jgi:hypothetical protein
VEVNLVSKEKNMFESFTKGNKKSEKLAELPGLEAAGTASTVTVENAANTAAPAAETPVPAAKPAKVAVPQAAISPEVAGYINTALTAGIREAMQALLPALQEMGLTERKLKILSGRDPEKEQAFKDRLLRERADWQRAEGERMANIARLQASCTHRDDNERSVFCVIHNFPDRNVRFVCPRCALMVEPKRWVIDSPEPITGRERSHIEPEHPLYRELLKGAANQQKL